MMLWLGFMMGQLIGWSTLRSIYVGAMIAISSTTIVVKAFEEQQVEGEFKQIVFGILIVQDLIAILLITILTAVSSGEELSGLEVAQTAGRLAAFLVTLLVVGLFIVPRLVRAVVRLNRSETTIVTSVGLAFGLAQLASALGYSVALGAFLAGALVAESGVELTIERLVQPVRDVFVAVFFVSVGMLIEPSEIGEHWMIVATLTVVVVAGMTTSIAMGSFLTGQSLRTSVRTGMSLAQIGEFSFIIVSIGIASGVIGQTLYSIAVAVCAFTALLTPWLIRYSGPAAAWADRKAPRALQTFGALYASWIEQLRAGTPDEHSARMRRAIRWLIVDAVVVAAIIIGASVEMDRIADFARARLNLSESWTKVLIVASATAISAPFWIGLVRMARFFGFELAGRVFPPAAGEKVDLAAAPRRLLVVTLQLTIVLLVGLPLVAVTQPFLPPLRGAAVLLFVLVLLAVAFWRGAANFQGHARAAAQALAETLARQTRHGRANKHGHAFQDASKLLAGFGSPVTVELRPDSPAVGKTLAEIELRGLTGATVLAIRRGAESVLIPSGRERLLAGDVLAVAGSHDAIEAARRLLSDRAHR
jgi:CPA2 family monovalent cation:H+ antiporter-2